MIGRKKNRGTGLADIPRSLSTLSVSWLNNQFKAVSVHRGKVLATWEKPGLYDGPDKFDEFIREAVRETGYTGHTLSLVLAHPRLVQQMVDVPPVKGTALNKVIQRQAFQQKYFSGEAAYASQMLVSAKNSPRVLIHLFPRLVLNQFMLACRRNNLDLVSAIPASAALQQQLPALGLQKGDIVALVAETAGSTTVVICDGDGRLLLARSLQTSWTEDAAKLAVDLNRTLLFTQQQYNLQVNRGLVIFGAGATEAAAVIQRQLQLPVKVSPVEYSPFFWATESLTVRPEVAPNFLSPELQKAPQRRIFAKIVGAASILLLAGSAALTYYSLKQARQEQATMTAMKEQVTKMEAREIVLDQLDAEMGRKQQAIQLVLGDKPPPKPAWLLAYLGQIVPADLVVTNFTVKREANYYRVRLGGTYQQASVTPNAPPIAASVEALKSQLATAPFHLRILETDASGRVINTGPSASAATGPRVPLGDWLNQIKQGLEKKIDPNTRREEVDHFVIEGVMR